MAIWVDADACPNVIKEILFRAAERTQTPLTLVANQNIRVPPSRFIRSLRVPAGFDVADNEIVRLCSAEDLVITADIPLAADVLEKGAAALNPRPLQNHALGELDDLALKLRKLIQSIRLLRGKVRQLAHNGTHPSAKHSASPKAADMTRFSGRCW